MTDPRWLSKNERWRMEHVIHRHPKRDEVFDKARELETIHEDTRRTARLLDHAEAADELIAEARETTIHAVKSFQWILDNEPHTGAAMKAAVTIGKLNQLLARVDALTKDTASSFAVDDLVLVDDDASNQPVPTNWPRWKNVPCRITIHNPNDAHVPERKGGRHYLVYAINSAAHGRAGRWVSAKQMRPYGVDPSP